MGLKA